MERREVLALIQEKLLEEFEVSEGRDSATIAKQLAEATRELESLPAGKGSSVDDLAQRRAARRAAASSEQPPPVSDVVGP